MIEVKYKSFGKLKTNCYVINCENYSIIIDPGENSFEWILENVQNNTPLAVLNTHGHYDHVYSNQKIKEYFSIPCIMHYNDRHLIVKDYFNVGLVPFEADMYIKSDVELAIGPFQFKLIHLPGHSLGSTIISFNEFIFTGDFVMENTVGRYNLPTSSKKDMHKSLTKFNLLFQDCNKKTVLYSGHGEPFNLEKGLKTINKWLNFF